MKRKLRFEPLETREVMSATPLWQPPAAVSVDLPAAHCEDGVQVSAALAAVSTRDPALWPFAADSPWNIGIGSGAQYATITGGMRSSGANLNVASWSIPVYFAKDTDPLVSVYWGNSLVARVNIPAGAKADPQGDAHLAIIDPTHSTVMEILGTRWRSSTRIDADVAVVNDLTDQGVYDSYHGARAYGGSAIAGLIRKDELASAYIPHALAVAVDPSSLNRHAPGGKPYVWPANSADGGTGRSYGTDGNLYMGSLLAIPRSVNIDALGLSPQALAVARALQDYGAYIVDQGGGNIIYYAEPGSNVTTSASELGRLTQYLRVVTNNGPNNVGGGGSRFVDPAPSFDGGDPIPPEPDPEPEPEPEPTPEPGPVQAFVVSGTLVDRNGNAIANQLVYLYIPGTDNPLQAVRTDSQGRYSFNDVEPGSYDVASSGGQIASYWESTRVNVTDADVSGIRLVIDVGGWSRWGRRR